MANIFKTKEAYKNTSPQIKVNPLRKVRGVYITGAYRPPHCLSHTLTVVKFENTKATIVKYTEDSRHANSDYSAAWLSVKENSKLSVKHYTTDAKHANSDYSAAWFSVREYSKFDVNRYTQSSSHTNSDYSAAWLSVHEHSGYTIKKYSHGYAPEFKNHALLNIQRIQTIDAIIETVDE